MQDDVSRRHARLKKDAQDKGYLLNPETGLTADLVSGLMENKKRYGEEYCPCRLITGAPEDNLDIICPCDYRDDDIAEYGSCFCGLYVSPETSEKGGPERQTPERRPAPGERGKKKKEVSAVSGALAYPVWRCSVCGYLCANTYPPRVCPVCKVKQDRFARFL